MTQRIPIVPREFFAQHVRTKDGDSFVLRPHFARIAGGVVAAEIPVRAYGFSTPELHEPLGPEARDATNTLLTNADTIWLIVMGYSFERTVCEVFIDGRTLDDQLKRQDIPVTSRMTKGFKELDLAV